MAKKISVELVDDLDGSAATETIKFGIDNTHYDIDLSEKNAARLRKALVDFVAAGRRTGGRQKARAGSKSTGDTSAVRSWAAANGFVVSDRGRIPLAVQEAYDKATLEWSKSLRP